MEIVTHPGDPVLSVLWFHGLGADGDDCAALVPQLHLPESLSIRFVFPNAPFRPVTWQGGRVMRAWFDLMGIGSEEDVSGLEAAAQEVSRLIGREEARGVPCDRIVLAGFSQGGALALYAGLRYPRRLGGILVLSGYLAVRERLDAERNPANQTTPIAILHGRRDALLPFDWAIAKREALERRGYPVSFQGYAIGHEICEDEILDVAAWLKDRCR